MDYWYRSIVNYQANKTKLTFTRIDVPMHVTDCVFIFFYLNENAKSLFLLLNGTQYASPE